MDFRVLGPVAVLDGERPIDVGGPRQRRLLSALLAAEGKVVSVDRLTELVWDDDDRPDGAAQAVRTYVARLRRSLQDAASAVITAPPGYALTLGEHTVDASMAQRLAADARAIGQTDVYRAIELFREALGLWRGDPYGELADLPWLTGEVQRLAELRRVIVEDLFEARLATGTGVAVIGDLERAVDEYPLSERLRRCQMEALLGSGRSVDATRAFHAYREYLADETGLEPGPELRQLEHDIVTGATAEPPGSSRPAPELPDGTVAFLFASVENTTRLWAEDPDGMASSLEVFDEVLGSAVTSHRGHVLSGTEDGFCAVFADGPSAVAAAQIAQSSLRRAPWSGPRLWVRMGLHLGEAGPRGGDYVGPVVETAARVGAAGHGGQILLTEAVHRATEHPLAIDLGVYRLPDVIDAQRLYQLNEGDFPALQVIPAHRSTLPVPMSPLVGREDEVRRVRALLRQHQLVTLTGVGGCGKTRLAIAVAEDELAAFEDGVYFADLGVVADDDGVAVAVGEALLLHLGTDRPVDRVRAHLTGKRVLVVLDNCEHVIDGCARLVEHVSASDGESRLLVTSREYLDVPGEHVLPLPPLSSSPGEGGPALFEARAQELDPGFVIDDSNRETVSALCEQLDGMPLALELAAARISVMSPAEMLERIDDRFRLLSGGRRSSRHRHGALGATLDWSYELLDPGEQELLDAMGVFRGPFDIEAVAGLRGIDTAEATTLVESLIKKSLVETVPRQGVTFYRLLETVRSYAESHLLRHGTLDATRHAHLTHYVAAMTATIGGPWDWGLTQRWLTMKPNMDAAVDWAIVSDRLSDAAVLLASASEIWREQRAIQPVLDRIDTVANKLPAGSEHREWLRIPELQLLLAVQDGERLREASARGLRSPNGMVKDVARYMSALISLVPEPARSLSLHDQASIDPASRSPWTLVRAYLDMFEGDYDEALRRLGPPGGLRGSMSYLHDAAVAATLLLAGRATAALDLSLGHRMADSAWNPFGLVVGLSYLALDDRESAERWLLADARSLAVDRMPGVSSAALVGLAALADHDGDRRWAAELILAAGEPRTVADNVLARRVAEEIGVGEQMIESQRAGWARWEHDPTEFLKNALDRWDTRRGAQQSVG